MAIDPRSLRPSELCRLLNSTPLGEVISERQLHRHRTRAGLRIGDGQTVDLLRYAAWLVVIRHSPKPEVVIDPYEELKDRARARNAALSLAGRDIGPIPPIADVERRRACMRDLKLFITTYNPAPFYFDWSPSQLRGIARIEDSVFNGGMFAFSWRRGGGKTSICRMTALWGLANAQIRYMAIIGANFPRASDNLEAVKKMMRFLPKFAADFPEISYPIQRLNGIANKVDGQLCQSHPTQMEWSSTRIALPTVPPPPNWPADWPLREDGMVPTSGALCAATGLTSDGLRGLLITLPTGEMLRPDFLFNDDPQTRESAHSPTQNDDRLQLIVADLLGLAGPGRPMGMVMPCTPIVEGDMVDQILDRQKYPQFRGDRSKTLVTMPSNMAAWETYFEIYAQCILLEPVDLTAANEHYLEHRAELDAGAQADWEDCKQPNEISAIQSAMHIYFRVGRRAFLAEYQTSPQVVEVGTAARQLVESDLIAKLDRRERGIVHRSWNLLTGMMDVHQDIIYWMICGWSQKFGGGIVDYGTFPKQRTSLFTMDKLTIRLADEFKDQDLKTRIYSGLKATTALMFGRSYRQDGAAGDLTLSLSMIDTGYMGDVVYDFISRSQHRALLKPSKGEGIMPGKMPMNEFKRNHPADRKGWNWRIDGQTMAKGRHVRFDTYPWKSQVANGILAPDGAPTAIYLPGNNISEHPLLAIHLLSEYRTPMFANGRWVDVWANRPSAGENHWWDCLIGCAVGAQVMGVQWDTAGSAGEKPRSASRARRMTFQEMIDSKKPIVV